MEKVFEKNKAAPLAKRVVFRYNILKHFERWYDANSELDTEGRVRELMKATLILANGAVFSGTSIGSTSDRVCEMVFNTSMTGYQEILTDPSYAGQGVVMSYPLIGNYGVNHEDNESSRPWVEAFVVRHLSPRGSNFRCEGDLGTYLKEHDITGIQDVDTRALTKILRSQGSMNGMITCAEHFNVADVLQKLKEYKVTDTVARVTRKEPEVFPAYGEEKHHVAMMDYGVKQHMIECLRRRGCKVTVLPAFTPAQEVLSGGFDGVMLSNGPGDPAENTAIIAELKKLYDSTIPIFGVCMGHQLLALATGAKTGRLGATTPSGTWRRAGCLSPARTTATWSCLTRWTPPWPRCLTSM